MFTPKPFLYLLFGASLFSQFIASSEAQKAGEKIPTGGWSGLGYTGNFSAITPNSSISDRLAKPLWKMHLRGIAEGKRP